MSARLLRDAPWFASPAAARVLALLNDDSEEARVVGGAVRNALMGLAVDDIDIATTAVPDEVMRRAKVAGIKSVPTGIAHGTVTLVIDKQPFEITTLREDVETFGRKAKVAFGRDWIVDAQRRDFTINGLSVSVDGVVHDHVGGLADIETRRVRFIGDPDRRIAEDYLRILRFFRIHASYGAGEPDRVGMLACIRGRKGIAGLSAERLRMEMMKLVVAEGAPAALTAMADGGLLLEILGGVAYIPAFAKMIAIERDTGARPDAILRLGALAVAVKEDAKRLATRLRQTSDETKALESMADGWWLLRGIDERTARRWLFRLGERGYRNRLILAWAREYQDTAKIDWPDLVALPDRWQPPKCPLRAADFMARGVDAGPALGGILRVAEDAWLAADFPMEDSIVAAIADRAMAEVSKELSKHN